ncbi:MarR family winged helix-turn-helix transcriptional regulator [Nocardioides convexus]|uniref:MarR family winged helix-turn-helix transcriptional regulator n=1 Tax=Nocardioides convexus TaxID=2712224 RepID=UPI002418324E|nr:MarR family winged helix-turn-helix transcriptional regulator [Nocardioides convexus]
MARHLAAPVLDDLICFDLYAASRQVTAAYRPILGELGLTYPQYLVLVLLGAHDEIPIKDVGREPAPRPRHALAAAAPPGARRAPHPSPQPVRRACGPGRAHRRRTRRPRALRGRALPHRRGAGHHRGAGRPGCAACCGC